MSKEELIRVIVRTAGLVFLVLAIVLVPKFLSEIFYYLYMSNDFSAAVALEHFRTREENGLHMKTARSMLLNSFTHIAIYLLSSWYLFKRGKFVQRLLGG